MLFQINDDRSLLACLVGDELNASHESLLS
jgi:hypothetical protein